MPYKKYHKSYLISIFSAFLEYYFKPLTFLLEKNNYSQRSWCFARIYMKIFFLIHMSLELAHLRKPFSTFNVKWYFCSYLWSTMTSRSIVFVLTFFFRKFYFYHLANIPFYPGIYDNHYQKYWPVVCYIVERRVDIWQCRPTSTARI